MVFDWGVLKWLSEIRVTGSGIAAGVVILEPGKGHLRHNHRARRRSSTTCPGKGSR